ncbi:purine nucleoside transporter PunC [Shewanella sp. Isolate11]|uniref:purine nucleoside transporter PunC n=1 Tax=Shewanella sp. Isolate11 TaxID=2908530 RepID=UPI001EFCE971|nr:purine nucleoside transporter PunC [Shewanella sp. Isolate11]MCG9696653.1 Bcr/CflA family multidrug efflux MFS transporter [Shewanella sp. Isolate11]
MNKSASLAFLGYLALLSMLGFIATDMYLPAFKAIEISLDTTSANVASTLTYFLAGLAIGQLLYGPLVLCWGKRNSLIFGLSMFAVASFIVALSDNIVMFNVGRFFQAIGACSASVIWQAIVIDKYDAKSAQKVFSNIMPLVALSPALAPILGAYLLEHSDWQTIFAVLTLLAGMLIIVTYLWVEPKPAIKASNNHTDVNTKPNQVSYFTMLKNPQYMGNVVIFGGCSAAFFSYLTLWPIVMQQHGYESTQIGLSFIPQTIMFILGGYFSKIWIKQRGVEQSLTLILSVFSLCIAAIATSTLILGSETIWPMLILFSILAAANGACYPIVVNSALQVFKQASAKAAGLQNFIQISMAFGASSIVAFWALGGKATISIAMLICAVIVLVATRVRKLSDWNSAKIHLQQPDPARISIHCDDGGTK